MYLKCVNGRYSFRYKLPFSLRQYFNNRGEILVSLKTTDLKIAQVKSLELKYETKLIIEKVKLMEALKLSEVQASVDQWIEDKLVEKYGATFQDNKSKENIVVDEMTYSMAITQYLKFFEYKTSSVDEYNAIASFFLYGFTMIMGAKTRIDIPLEETLFKLDELASLPKMNAQKIRCGTTRVELLSNKNKISENTFAKYIKWTRAFYHWAYSNGHTEINIAANIRKITKTTAIEQRSLLTDIEVTSLLRLAEVESKDLYTMVKILAYSGMRHSEFFKMKIKRESFDLSSQNIKLKTASSHREIPRHDKLLEIDDEYIRELQRMYNYRDLTKMGMKLIRKITLDKSKVLYSLRHSLASKLQNELVATPIISQILGHMKDSSITTARYAKGYNLDILIGSINKLTYNTPPESHQ